MRIKWPKVRVSKKLSVAVGTGAVIYAGAKLSGRPVPYGDIQDIAISYILGQSAVDIAQRVKQPQEKQGG